MTDGFSFGVDSTDLIPFYNLLSVFRRLSNGGVSIDGQLMVRDLVGRLVWADDYSDCYSDTERFGNSMYVLVLKYFAE